MLINILYKIVKKYEGKNVMSNQYLPNISYKQRQEIINRIFNYYSNDTYYERDRQILYQVFAQEMPISEIAKSGQFISKRGNPISMRMIQKIVHDFDPELYEKYKKGKSTTRNREHLDNTRKCKSMINYKVCAMCGETQNLELHHMIPIAMGGTTDKLNLVYLCKQCHRQVTNYHIRQYSEFRKNGEVKQNDNEGENNLTDTT